MSSHAPSARPPPSCSQSLVLQMCLTRDKCTFYKPLRLKPTHVQEHSCKTRNLLIAHQKKKKNYGRTNRSRDHCTEDPLRQVCSNIDSSLERGAISDPQPPGEMSVDCVRDYQLDDERDGAADTFASRTAAGRHVNTVRPGNTLTILLTSYMLLAAVTQATGYFLRTNPIQTLPFTTSSCVICAFPPVASRERGKWGMCQKQKTTLIIVELAPDKGNAAMRMHSSVLRFTYFRQSAREASRALKRKDKLANIFS